MQFPESITGAYLRGRIQIPVPKERRKPTGDVYKRQAQILDKFRTVFQIIKIEVLRKRRKFTVKFKILRMTSITHLTDITTDVVWILDISDC